jgi:FAD/FMN-containing dehydrogenase
MFAGASNAVGGITIDLKYLNGITLSDDQETANIGPGNRWGDVYEKLEPKGLTVVGGRVTDVGVGGFMLGGKSTQDSWRRSLTVDQGGISFLSRFHGWASDNVRNFEVRSCIRGPTPRAETMRTGRSSQWLHFKH